jgi:hypothetical protein
MTLSCRTKNNYKEYIPTYFNGNFLYTSSDSLTEQHKKNIQHVFKYYGVPVKVDGQRLLYKGDIDKELMWNYTTKANDSEWIMSHLF